MSQIPYVNASCQTASTAADDDKKDQYAAYEGVMSHMCVSHVPHVNESCPICERVMPHMWMGHVSYVNGSCSICE